ncbi:MAG: hypothetical protein HRT41_05370 [Campylobacteraceae bacterium]|nr:hypothetical protein [Campylobacteraceae bacterium]
MKIKIIIFIFISVIFISLLEENNYEIRNLNFVHKSEKIEGKLILPLNKNLLSIFASDDENIDINESIRVLKKELINLNNFSLKVFDKSQHAMLKNKYFKNTKYDLWFLFKPNILGTDAFVDGYEELIINWIKNEV